MFELVDRIGKIESAIGEKANLDDDKGSCSVKFPSHCSEHDDEDVVLVDKIDTLQVIGLYLK